MMACVGRCSVGVDSSRTRAATVAWVSLMSDPHTGGHGESGLPVRCCGGQGPSRYGKDEQHHRQAGGKDPGHGLCRAGHARAVHRAPLRPTDAIAIRWAVTSSR